LVNYIAENTTGAIL